VERARLLALFVVAVGIRLLYVSSLPADSPIASVDAWGYHRLALNLAEGNGFSLRRAAPFVPDSVRTPLYPLFLLLIRRSLGPAPRMAATVQAILDGCTALLTGWLATALATTPTPLPASLSTRPAHHRAGRIAALLYALHPTQVRYVNDLLAETLLSFLLTLCACALVRYVQTLSTTEAQRAQRGASTEQPVTRTLRALRVSVVAHLRRSSTRWLCLVALLTGLATLCKPNVQFLPLIWICAIALAHRRDWRRALADAGTMALVVACVLLPWAIRNRLVFGRWFLSTAFEGNVSRISAPATLAAARGAYVIPWSAEWEGLFGEIVSQAAARYGWTKPWDTLTARELDAQNRQVYLVAGEVLRQHPLAWVGSHLQGMGRYLEPQTYKVCYARFSGQAWPPDILDDAVIHVGRAIGRGDWAEAGRIVAEERWHKFDVLRGVTWWGTFGGQVLGLIMALRGARRLWATHSGRRQPVLAVAMLLTVSYVLLVPGPIAYERFLVPVTSLIVALIATNLGWAVRSRRFIADLGQAQIDLTNPDFSPTIDAR
jgi:hypothetical protein